ncbi:hypothetical protein Ancab_034054 [Ancistrocladus abbreviatus]
MHLPETIDGDITDDWEQHKHAPTPVADEYSESRLNSIASKPAPCKGHIRFFNVELFLPKRHRQARQSSHSLEDKEGEPLSPSDMDASQGLGKGPSFLLHHIRPANPKKRAARIEAFNEEVGDLEANCCGPELNGRSSVGTEYAFGPPANEPTNFIRMEGSTLLPSGTNVGRRPKKKVLQLRLSKWATSKSRRSLQSKG